MIGSSGIGTEHLLLGMVNEREGVAAKALTLVGLSDVERVRQVVSGLGGGSESESPPGHLPFTPRSRKVLELALREALTLGHNYVGTEHLLLGLVREGEGIGPRVITAMSSMPEGGLEATRRTVLDLLASYTKPVPAPAAPVEDTPPETVVVILDPVYAKEILDVLDGLHQAIFRGTWGTHPLSGLQAKLEECLMTLTERTARESD